ncbi:MAG: hypothetical protein HY721_21740 [Planctomycetes bacterium]|nr:hypothetical protein [Planctomycetota bacterium]
MRGEPFGRCVLLGPDAPGDPRRFQERGYPAPEAPFQGWRGPVPELLPLE